MEQDSGEILDGDDISAPGEHVLGPRRRIVAHEVKSASFTTLSPVDLPSKQLREQGVEPPQPRFGDVTIVDPTVAFGTRRRRRGQRWAHRMTALTALAAFVTTSLSIALLLDDDRGWAWITVVLGMGFAGASMYLSRGQLASRRRGYAIAAVVFAFIAVAMNFEGDAVHESVSDYHATVPRRH